jgi:hypothetical protein
MGGLTGAQGRQKVHETNATASVVDMTAKWAVASCVSHRFGR